MDTPNHTDYRKPNVYHICSAFGSGKQAECGNYKRGTRFCRHTRDAGVLGFICALDQEGPEVL